MSLAYMHLYVEQGAKVTVSDLTPEVNVNQGNLKWYLGYTGDQNMSSLLLIRSHQVVRIGFLYEASLLLFRIQNYGTSD